MFVQVLATAKGRRAGLWAFKCPSRGAEDTEKCEFRFHRDPDFCVGWSAEDAHREGFEVIVVEDACRGIDIDGSIAHTRNRLASLGIPMVATGDVVA